MQRKADQSRADQGWVVLKGAEKNRDEEQNRVKQIAEEQCRKDKKHCNAL